MNTAERKVIVEAIGGIGDHERGAVVGWETGKETVTLGAKDSGTAVTLSLSPEEAAKVGRALLEASLSITHPTLDGDVAAFMERLRAGDVQGAAGLLR